MRLLLDDGVDINSIASYSRRTALSVVSSQGALKAVEFLLTNGAGVNSLDTDGSTPLMHACSLGKKKGFLVAQRLIAAGANVNHARSNQGTALKAAIDGQNPNLLQLLIDNGAEVDGPKGTSQTALMLAARNNDVKALTVLVEYSISDGHGGTDTATVTMTIAGRNDAPALWKTPKSNVVRIRVDVEATIFAVSLASYVYPSAVQNGRRRTKGILGSYGIPAPSEPRFCINFRAMSMA